MKLSPALLFGNFNEKIECASFLLETFTSIMLYPCIIGVRRNIFANNEQQFRARIRKCIDMYISYTRANTFTKAHCSEKRISVYFIHADAFRFTQIENHHNTCIKRALIRY